MLVRGGGVARYQLCRSLYIWRVLYLPRDMGGGLFVRFPLVIKEPMVVVSGRVGSSSFVVGGDPSK